MLKPFLVWHKTQHNIQLERFISEEAAGGRFEQLKLNPDTLEVGQAKIECVQSRTGWIDV